MFAPSDTAIAKLPQLASLSADSDGLKQVWLFFNWMLLMKGLFDAVVEGGKCFVHTVDNLTNTVGLIHPFLYIILGSSSFSSYRPGAKIEQIQSPQTVATTFVFSSVSILLLWQYRGLLKFLCVAFYQLTICLWYCYWYSNVPNRFYS